MFNCFQNSKFQFTNYKPTWLRELLTQRFGKGLDSPDMYCCCCCCCCCCWGGGGCCCCCCCRSIINPLRLLLPPWLWIPLIKWPVGLVDPPFETLLARLAMLCARPLFKPLPAVGGLERSDERTRLPPPLRPFSWPPIGREIGGCLLPLPTAMLLPESSGLDLQNLNE